MREIGLAKIHVKGIIWIIACYVFIVLSLFSINMGNTTIRLIGLVLFVILALLLSTENLLVLMAIIEPFSIVFKIQNSFSVMPFLFVILAIKTFNWRGKYSYKIFMPLLALMSIGFIVVLMRGFSIVSFLSFYLYLLCFIFVLKNENIDLEHVFETISFWYILSVIIECVLSSYLTNAVSVITKVSVYNLRNIGFSNEWEFGRHIVVAIAFCLTNVLKRKKLPVLYIGAIIFLVYKLTSTGLYSGLLAICLLAMCLPFIYKGSTSRKALLFIVTLLISIGLLLLAYYYVYIPMYNLRGQFTDNGRYNAWLAYIHDLSNSFSLLFFGAGAGCINDYAVSVHRITTHNILLEKLTEFGILGLLGLASILRNTYRGYTFKLNDNLNVFPLIGFLGTTITQGITGSELIFILMMICAKTITKNDSSKEGDSI